jgi:[protein-PII] uridylyltransferase
MNDRSGYIRDFLAVRREEIAARHRSGEDSFATCVDLTAMTDEAIRTSFDTLSPEERESMAILALGGYGRVELCPRSDVDVMVLIVPDADRRAAGGAARGFLHALWDAGIDVGHSVRTVDDALSLHRESLDAWTSMIESRVVCGSPAIARALEEAQRRRIDAGPHEWFIEGVIGNLESRHERYGHAVKLLEPNVKKSSGGLRDLHALFWLYRGTQPSWFNRIGTEAPACAVFLDALRREGLLESDDHAAAIAAFRFLLRVRHAMHLARGAPDDTLEYAMQHAVAEGLGFGTKAELRSVEVFMREYYIAARTIHRLYHQLGHLFREQVGTHHATPDSGDPDSGNPDSVERASGEPVGELFTVHDDILSARSGVSAFADPLSILEMFALAAENGASPDYSLRRAAERSVDLLTPGAIASDAFTVQFRRILRSRYVASTLRSMNDLDVLGRVIPEFGALVAFFQHNVYHFYTADVHTLIALAHAEGLRDEQGVLHDVFRNLRRKDVLFMAILLHDIAKPRGVGDHEITGVAMSATILARLGMDDAIPLVGFLVRNHLVMEQTAFRRNIHDSQTIAEFAARFTKPEELDYLYVLTYADLSAVNPNVWTGWKAAMLQDLYQSTAEVLRRDLRGEQIAEFHQARQVRAVESVVQALSEVMPRDVVERHLAAMQNDSYITVFTEEEIGEHIARSVLKESVSTLLRHSEGYTEVTVIARDAPFALSRFCAVLAANDATILDANIFTRQDGIIIDRFRVSGAATRQHLEAQVCAKIADDLRQVMDGRLDVERLFSEHRRRWRRRPTLPLNPTIRTDVTFEDNPRYTIIDVYAPDAVGLLYRITEAISRLGLDIAFAKIATRVDGIVDAFYTLDRTGAPVTDANRKATIREEILRAVATMSDQELA